MRKTLVYIICTILLFISGKTRISAQKHDMRAVQMREVLSQYDSPMVGLEDVLIQTAQKYGLDWTLLAAIAGTESSFARRMPYQCNNPYGWGIYGSNKYNLSTLESIAHTYNTVSTDSWISHTRFFMRKIKTAQIPVSALPITL